MSAYSAPLQRPRIATWSVCVGASTKFHSTHAPATTSSAVPVMLVAFHSRPRAPTACVVLDIRGPHPVPLNGTGWPGMQPDHPVYAVPCYLRASAAQRPRLQELLVVVLHQVERHVLHGHVARLIDPELLAEDRLVGRDRDARERRRVDALAGAVGLGDRGQDQLRGSRAVDAVERRRIMTVGGLEVGDELAAEATLLHELARRDAGERDVHALSLGHLVQLGVAGEAV